MSFTKEKREQIKRYILEKINERKSDIAKKVSEIFDISLNTVYRYIRDMEKDGLIEKRGDCYRLVETCGAVKLKRKDGGLKDEDVIYEEYISGYIDELPDNVQRIWQYSFMEMMNNAIDHSGSEEVRLAIYTNILNVTILIMDRGIGIFRKIKEYYKYDSLDDAVTELFNGKLTTDQKNHSGEGIFFTSRVLDVFAVISDGKIFTHDKYDEALRNLKDVKALRDWEHEPGTIVYMELSNFSNKNLMETFDLFSNVDGGFMKTRIPIKNIYETYPVSRSQAKRLYHRFDKFQEVELDFDAVSEIGQGFAHELFVVFSNKHPDIRLTPINVSPEVQKMINHVKYTLN